MTIGQIDYPIARLNNGSSENTIDAVAEEEPLQRYVIFTDKNREKQQVNLGITMRTPGGDRMLMAGHLFNQQIIQSGEEILRLALCKNENNVIKAYLDIGEFNAPIRRYEAHSSCGVCGDDFILDDHPPLSYSFLPCGEIIEKCRREFNQAQNLFHSTGGIHACAFFSKNGDLVNIAEDIGRHNALDKLIGAHILEDKVHQLRDHILFLSGRVGYDMIQKAAVARVPTILAFGAPTSLAVKLAKKYNLTLIGFLKRNRYNIYN